MGVDDTQVMPAQATHTQGATGEHRDPSGWDGWAVSRPVSWLGRCSVASHRALSGRRGLACEDIATVSAARESVTVTGKIQLRKKIKEIIRPEVARWSACGQLGHACTHTRPRDFVRLH